MLVSNIDWSDYVGRIAVGKILGGVIKVGDPVFVVRHAEPGKKVRAKITKVFEFTGLGQREVEQFLASIDEDDDVQHIYTNLEA
jgi:GTP-binding protein